MDEYHCPAVEQHKGGIDTESTLRSPRARRLQRRSSLTRAGIARRLSAAAALSPRAETKVEDDGSVWQKIAVAQLYWWFWYPTVFIAVSPVHNSLVFRCELIDATMLFLCCESL